MAIFEQLNRLIETRQRLTANRYAHHRYTLYPKTFALPIRILTTHQRSSPLKHEPLTDKILVVQAYASTIVCGPYFGDTSMANYSSIGDSKVVDMEIRPTRIFQ